MIAIFNRRELITLASMQKLTCVREALSTAGIVSAVKIRGAAGVADRARHGIGGGQADSLYTYKICVHRDDHDRAAAVMQSALRRS